MSAASDIISLWPTVRSFADDIGVKLSHAHVMKVRGAIPAARWPRVADAAKRRSIHLSLERIVQLHGSEPSAGPAPHVHVHEGRNDGAAA